MRSWFHSRCSRQIVGDGDVGSYNQAERRQENNLSAFFSCRVLSQDGSGLVLYIWSILIAVRTRNRRTSASVRGWSDFAMYFRSEDGGPRIANWIFVYSKSRKRFKSNQHEFFFCERIAGSWLLVSVGGRLVFLFWTTESD